MGSSQIRKTGADQGAKADGKKSGYTIDPGPYVAVVVSHVAGTRSGQLKVYIPDWGGVQGKDSDQMTVSYASPFYGTTFGTNTQQLPDGSVTAGQSYGMWMVPPDVGCKVLVTFAAGDQSNGYWFACVYDSVSHHMVPGLGRNIGGTDKTQISTALNGKVTGDSVLPTVEYSTTAKTAFDSDGITQTPRYAHDYQSYILINQGLDKDKIRGAVSSSSLRESPSNVYGISTPGPRATNKDQIPGSPEKTIFRKGGHSFIMDDGDNNGNDQLIRLRTSGGHQILMNDKEHVLYIASDSGMQWMEFSSTGAINVYSKGGYNVRTEGPMNLHSDSAVSIQGSSVTICGAGGKGAGGVKIETTGSLSMSAMSTASLKANAMLTLSTLGMGKFSAGGTLDLSAIGKTTVFGSMLMLNSGKPGLPSPALPPTLKSLKDVKLSGGVWQPVPGALQTVCTVAPAHEPWVEANGKRPAK